VLFVCRSSERPDSLVFFQLRALHAVRRWILFGIIPAQVPGWGPVVPPPLDSALEEHTMGLPDLQMTYRKHGHVSGIHGIQPCWRLFRWHRL